MERSYRSRRSHDSSAVGYSSAVLVVTLAVVSPRSVADLSIAACSYPILEASSRSPNEAALFPKSELLMEALITALAADPRLYGRLEHYIMHHVRAVIAGHIYPCFLARSLMYVGRPLAFD